MERIKLSRDDLKQLKPGQYFITILSSDSNPFEVKTLNLVLTNGYVNLETNTFYSNTSISEDRTRYLSDQLGRFYTKKTQQIAWSQETFPREYINTKLIHNNSERVYEILDIGLHFIILRNQHSLAIAAIAYHEIHKYYRSLSDNVKLSTKIETIEPI